MTTSTENNPIYFQVLKGWMATHQERMPGVVPTPGEPEDHPWWTPHAWTMLLRTASPPGVATWTQPNAEPARRRDSHLDGPPRGRRSTTG